MFAKLARGHARCSTVFECIRDCEGPWRHEKVLKLAQVHKYIPGPKGHESCSQLENALAFLRRWGRWTVLDDAGNNGSNKNKDKKNSKKNNKAQGRAGKKDSFRSFYFSQVSLTAIEVSEDEHLARHHVIS